MGLIDWAARATRAARPAMEALADRFERKLARGRILGRDRRDFISFYRRDRTILDAFAAADWLIAPSRFLRDLFVSQVPQLDPRRVVLSDCGMRADGLYSGPKTPDPRGRLRFGFIGSLVPYKGIETAIEAVRRAGDPRAVLLVFGKFEPATDPFHARLAALAPAESVVFRGPFEHRDLPAILGEIDVLVVPSLWWENAPLTIRESHLSRTPVVATGHGGMAESVREGRDGYLFRAGDPSDLARVMLGLLARHQQNDWPRFDFPERKTIREDASELEFRYRAAMARRRAESPAVLREARGRDFASSEGTVEIQGARSPSCARAAAARGPAMPSSRRMGVRPSSSWSSWRSGSSPTSRSEAPSR